MKTTKQHETSPPDPWTVWSERPAAPDDVCRALGNGSTLRDWSHANQFDFQVVADWLLQDPGRAAKYERSQQIYAIHLREVIIALGDDSSQDLLTDDKGKTTINHAHFRRQQRQIEVRKCALRELRAERKKATKNQQPYVDLEAEINQILTQPGPYDPKGTLKAYKPSPPAYDPGPPPLSRPAPSSQSVINSPLRLDRGEGKGEVSIPALNTYPLITDDSSSAPRPLGREVQDHVAAVPDHVVGRDSVEPTLLAQPARAERASQESGKTGIEAQTNPPVASLNTAPLITDDSSSAPRPLGGEGAQRAGEGVSPTTTNNEQRTTNQSTKPTPKATIGGGVPKIDWHSLLGMRKLSTFLALFILFLTTAAANLHASIHSLSVPIGNHQDQPDLSESFTLSDLHRQTWSAPRPETDPPRTTNYERQTNPSEQYRHSRDAPCFPLNTEH